MNIENIQSLAETLSGLGFTSDLRNQLLFYACLKQKEFSIRDQKVFGTDTVSYQIFFRSKEEELICTHYDASLRGRSGLIRQLKPEQPLNLWKRKCNP